MIGATSGLVAAPCGAPAFAAVLTFVGATGSAGLGFLYLLVFSLGMSALLVAVGLSAGALAALPRSGPWMGRIKRIGGALLLVMAHTSSSGAEFDWTVAAPRDPRDPPGCRGGTG
jgi:thiol:disulfide interchange protein DsbD